MIDFAVIAIGLAIPLGIFVTSTGVRARYYSRRELGWNWLLAFAYAMPTWALLSGAGAVGWLIAWITLP